MFIFTLKSKFSQLRETYIHHIISSIQRYLRYLNSLFCYVGATAWNKPPHDMLMFSEEVAYQKRLQAHAEIGLRHDVDATGYGDFIIGDHHRRVPCRKSKLYIYIYIYIYIYNLYIYILIYIHIY